MDDKDVEVIEEKTLYSMTDYNKKVWWNRVFVTILIIITLTLVVLLANTFLSLTVIPMLGRVPHEATEPYRYFLRERLMDEEYPAEYKREVRNFLENEDGAYIEEKYITLLNTVVLGLVGFCSLLVCVVMSLYIRNNLDVMINNMGTLQKRGLMYGLEENLEREKMFALGGERVMNSSTSIREFPKKK